MPIAALKFKLPEEQYEFDIAIKANDTKRMLWDFSQQLRSWQKYSNNFNDAGDALDKIRTEFHRLVTQYNINID